MEVAKEPFLPDDTLLAQGGRFETENKSVIKQIRKDIGHFKEHNSSLSRNLHSLKLKKCENVSTAKLKLEEE